MPPDRAAVREKMFYGWVIVGVMASANAASMAMASLNFGLFIRPMGDELGIGRSMFGWAQTARQVGSSVTSPVVGGILDRHGARVLLAVAGASVAVAMVGLSFANNAWQVILCFAVMGVVGMNGAGSLITTVPVAKWFVSKRGKAISYMSLGIPVGALIFIPLSEIFIDAWGWRTAWIALAGIGAGIIVPLSLLFVRRQPEDQGLLPDGAPHPDSVAGRAAAARNPGVAETVWTVREAVRTAAFWRLVVVFSLVSLAVATFGVHRIPSFVDRGLSTRLISFAAAMDAVCAGLSTFALGMLVGRFPARVLGGFGFLMLTLACVLTIYAYSAMVMFLSMMAFGVGIGGLLFLQSFLWADYFGRANIGKIRGVVTPIILVIGGIGAPLAGYVRDATGSYNAIWWAGVVVLLLGAVSILFTPAPKKPVAVAPLA
ncbi:MAG: MFS transporter [Dehalococcoidia bacterium]|nr:MFS transporter [Dehalococcoidia bacterium]